MAIFQNANAITPVLADFAPKSIRAQDAQYLSRTPLLEGNRKIWTFSCWLKKQSVAGQDYGVMLGAYSDGSNRDKLNFESLAQQMHMQLIIGGTTYDILATGYSRDQAGWQHIVCRVDTTDPTEADRWKFYINGDLIPVSEVSAGYPPQNTNSWINDDKINYVCARNFNGSADSASFLSGYMSEVFFIDGQALLPGVFAETDSVTGIWKPTKSSTVKEAVVFGQNGYYLPFSDDKDNAYFKDSMNNLAQPWGTVHTDTTEKKWGTASAQFDGDSDYLTIPNNTAWDIAGNTYNPSTTIDFWVKHTSASGTQAYLTQRTDGNNYWHLRHDTNVGSLNLQCVSGGTSFINDTQSTFSDTTTWHHICVYIHRATGGANSFQYGVYVDGVQKLWDNASNANVTLTQTTAPLVLGARINSSSSADNYLNGYMDEVRWTRGGNPFNCQPNSGRTDTITVPTSAHTENGATMLLLHMDGANDGILFPDSSTAGQRHTVTPAADADNERVSNHPCSVFGYTHIVGPVMGHSSCITFDGDGDGLTVADSTDFDLSNQPFTWEAWVNPGSNIGSFPTILEQYQSGSERTFLRIERQGGLDRFEWEVDSASTGNFSVVASGIPTYNSWTHVAVCRVGNVFTIYVNGVAEGTTTNSSTIPARSAVFRIGDWGGNNTSGDWRGYMDGIRLSNVARYTANFDSPTTGFTSDANTMLLIQSNTTMGSTTFDDESSGDHAITVLDGCMHAAPKIGAGMAYFSSTSDDYLEANSRGEDWDFPNATDFTMECWMYNRTQQAANNSFLCSDTSGSNNGFEIEWDGSYKMAMYIPMISSDKWVESDAATPVGSWWHLAIQRKDTAFTMYINGVAQTATGNTTTSNFLSASSLRLGQHRSSTSRYMDNTYVDEFRFSRAARYSANFTPSTTAFIDDKDTVLLWHMNGGGTGDSVIGEGQWFADSSCNAIFYDGDGNPLANSNSYYTFDGTGDYLNIKQDPSTAGKDKSWCPGTEDFTLEYWQNSQTTTGDRVWSAGGWGNPRYDECFNRPISKSASWIKIMDDSQNSGAAGATFELGSTTYEYASTGSWNHIAFVREGVNLRLYVNGVQQKTRGDFPIAGTINTNTSNLSIGSATGTLRGDQGVTENYTGKMDQFRISNISRYPSGTTFAVPTAPFERDDNTMLLIQSQFSGGEMGADDSGNFNYWSPTSVSWQTQSEDSPLNNFCTLNWSTPSYSSTTDKHQISYAGTGLFTPSDANWYTEVGTIMIPSSGKWYWETGGISNSGGSPEWLIGILPATVVGRSNLYGYKLGNQSGEYGYMSNSNWRTAGGNITWPGGSDYNEGNRLGIGLDLDNNKIYVHIDGIWQGGAGGTRADPSAGIGGISISATPTGGNWLPAFSTQNGRWPTINFGTGNTDPGSGLGGSQIAWSVYPDSNGIGLFAYEPPTGFLALCTSNLSADITKPNTHVAPILYSGNQTVRSIDVGFKPDLVWIKARNDADQHNIYDSVRGATKQLHSNDAAVEDTDAATLTGFESNGFALGDDTSHSGTNRTGETYVAWCWKAGGAPTATNTETSGNMTAGSAFINGSSTTYNPGSTIYPKKVSANREAGFSMVQYVGNGTSGATVGHGLNVAPLFVIVKSLDISGGASSGSGWVVGGAEVMGANNYIYLNDNGTEVSDTGRWNGTKPGASVFTLGDDGVVNTSAKNYIAYLWHNVEGFSKIGYYNGNSNAWGPTVYTGFRPAMILFKNTGNTGNWQWQDDQRSPQNIMNAALYPDTNGAEGTAAVMDFYSNGFRIKETGSSLNGSGTSTMYMAFASTPFKTALGY